LEALPFGGGGADGFGLSQLARCPISGGFRLASLCR